MKVILITGYEKTGKSTTCNILKERIVINMKGSVILNTVPKATKDFVGIYKVNGKYIGISSYGDTEDMVKNGFLEIINFATSHNIILDIMFFTSRSKGKTTKKLLS